MDGEGQGSMLALDLGFLAPPWSQVTQVSRT